MTNTEAEQVEPLDDVFDDGLDAHSAEPAEPATEPAQEPAEPTGVNPPAEPEPEAPPTSEEPENQMVPREALDAERQKRREYEQQLQALQNQQPQQQPEPEPEIDDDLYWEDPKAAVKQELVPLQQQLHDGLYQTRLALSETFMRSQHEDYDEVAKVVGDVVEKDPRGPLAQQIYAHPTPATHAYNLGKQMQLMNEIGSDPTAYREKIKAEVQAELNGTAQTPSQTTQAPTSLASVPSAPPSHASRAPDHTPLEDIFTD